MTASEKLIKQTAEFLDTKHPDWHSKIDLSVFDMSSHVNCVLGQLYGGFSRGLDALNVSGTKFANAFSGYDAEWSDAIHERIGYVDNDDDEGECFTITFNNKVILATRNEDRARQLVKDAELVDRVVDMQTIRIED